MKPTAPNPHTCTPSDAVAYGADILRTAEELQPHAPRRLTGQLIPGYRDDDSVNSASYLAHLGTLPVHAWADTGIGARRMLCVELGGVYDRITVSLTFDADLDVRILAHALRQHRMHYTAVTT